MKTIKSMIYDAQSKMIMWSEISEDEQALIDRGKTKQDALMLLNYFEGKLAGLVESERLNKT